MERYVSVFTPGSVDLILSDSSNAVKASLSMPNVDVSLATTVLEPIYADDPFIWSLQESTFKRYTMCLYLR